MSGSKPVRSDQAAKKTPVITITGIEHVRKTNNQTKHTKDLQMHGINNDKIFTKSKDVAALFYSHLFRSLQI